MTKKEIMDFLDEAARAGSILGLDNIRNLMSALGNIQDSFAVIHIAGTNGKGSVGAYVSSIFREAGHTVGRFCSPAVFSPYEMWMYQEENIGEEEFLTVMSQVRAACDIVVSEGHGRPTLFEIQTAAAFVWFHEKKPDLVILETGMGGARDATNVIRLPLCSVITTISLDHTNMLGETLEEIAEEKAGIIKEGRPVFFATQTPQVEQIIRERAGELHAPAAMVKRDSIRLVEQGPEKLVFYYRDILLSTKMAGSCQMMNASLALKLSYYMLPLLNRHCRMVEEGMPPEESLKLMGPEESPEVEEQLAELAEADTRMLWKFLRLHEISTPQKFSTMWRMVNGIEKAKWQGRFEVLGREPWFIIDGAHNEGAVLSLAQTVEQCFAGEKLALIIGVFADKAHEKMLEIMAPFAGRILCVAPESGRRLPADQLAEEAKRICEEVICCEDLSQAVARAHEAMMPILAFGSLSYLGQLRACYEVFRESERWEELHEAYMQKERHREDQIDEELRYI